MSTRFVFAAMVALGLVATGAFAQQPGPVKNVMVYDEPGRYAGWPANGGIWSWGNEIVVGFYIGYYKEGPGSYPIDRDKAQVTRQARSVDGGETWTLEKPAYLDADEKQKEPTPCPGNIDFKQPNFAMKFLMEDSNEGASFFYWSNDRCKTWHGPYQLPLFDRKAIMARTDYLVDGKHSMTAFLSAAKDGGGEGWPFCARTTDGGRSWKFLSWIGEQPGPGGYAIMPASVRLSKRELYTYIRCRGGVKPNAHWWDEPYRSMDNGKTWKLEKENTVDVGYGGNPPHMIKLADGRLALTYGFRSEPIRINARLSEDGGKTWGKDIVLRDDAAAWDIGYTRTVQRTDGKIVTVYYFNDKTRKERYIAATIWDPGEKSGSANPAARGTKHSGKP